MNTIINRSRDMLKEAKDPNLWGPNFIYDYARPHVKEWAMKKENYPSLIRKLGLNKSKEMFGSNSFFTGITDKLFKPEFIEKLLKIPAANDIITTQLDGLSDKAWDKHTSNYLKRQWDKYKTPILTGGGGLLALYMLSRMFNGGGQQPPARAYSQRRPTNNGLWLS